MDFPSYGLPESRLPPSNLQAEQALLGALISDPGINLGTLRLKTEHFVDPIHGIIFRTITQWSEAKRLISVDRLKAEFDRSDALNEVGGTAYLAQLLTAMVGTINAGEYAASIRDAWIRRQLIEIGEQIIAYAFGEQPERDGGEFPPFDGSEQLELARHEIAKLTAEVAP